MLAGLSVAEGWPERSWGYHERIVGPELLLLVVVLVVVLIWRGPNALPRLGEALGKTVKGVRENVPGAMKDDPSDSDGSADSSDRTDS